jgi:hypothetical protein
MGVFGILPTPNVFAGYAYYALKYTLVPSSVGIPLPELVAFSVFSGLSSYHAVTRWNQCNFRNLFLLNQL